MKSGSSSFGPTSWEEVPKKIPPRKRQGEGGQSPPQGKNDPSSALDGDTSSGGQPDGCGSSAIPEVDSGQHTRGESSPATEKIPGGGPPEANRPDGDSSQGAGESRQQNGQTAEGGTSTARSETPGEASCHPLAKKCDAGSDEPELSEAQYWRKRRYGRREALWRTTDVQRCAYCGRVPYSADQNIECYREEWTEGGEERSSARVEGVQTCGNVNLCPVCAREPRQERAAMINEAVRRHLDAGGGVIEFLFTLRHDEGHSLRQQLDAMAAGWEAMMQPSKSWGARKVREQMGHVGHYWANEAPWNPVNGWHVHRHGLLFVEKPLPADELQEVEKRLYRLYKDAVQEAGMPCPSKDYNNLRRLRDGEEPPDEIGGYLMKTDSEAGTRTGRLPGDRAGEEMVRGDEKQGQKGLMPFQILDRVGEAYQALDHFRSKLEQVRQRGGETKWKRLRVRKVQEELGRWERLWSEYETEVEGEKMMQGSRGFEEQFCPSDDEEESDPEPERTEEKVGEIPAHLWRHLCRFSGGVSALYEAIEGQGRIRRSGNRITAIGEGDPADFGELVEALRLDWWQFEVDETQGDGPLVGVQYLNRTLLTESAATAEVR